MHKAFKKEKLSQHHVESRSSWNNTILHSFLGTSSLVWESLCPSHVSWLLHSHFHIGPLPKSQPFITDSIFKNISQDVSRKWVSVGGMLAQSSVAVEYVCMYCLIMTIWHMVKHPHMKKGWLLSLMFFLIFYFPFHFSYKNLLIYWDIMTCLAKSGAQIKNNYQFRLIMLVSSVK